jgi:nucleoside-diphosphate-sugar epimerase
LKHSDWEARYDALVDTVIAAAQINNATIVFPGNVYIYGKNPDPVWGPDTAHHAANTRCKVRSRVEARLESSGVQTIIVRSGDFIDTEQSGTWFDMVVSKNLKKGILTYPGDATARHAWGFLPDVARAAVDLVEKRANWTTL